MKGEMKNLLRNLINRFPKAKSIIQRLVQRLFPSMWVSARYIEMSGAEQGREAARLRMAWTDQDIPARQRELVDKQLAEYKR